METPSENEQATEDQKETVGEAFEADLKKIAEGADDPEDSKPDPAEDDAPEPTPDDLAGDAAAAVAEDAEIGTGDVRDFGAVPDAQIVSDDEQGDDAEPELGRGHPETAAAAPPYGCMKSYRCIKTVDAFKIDDMESLSNGEARLIAKGGVYWLRVGAAYMDQHRPTIGSYYVRDHEGVCSCKLAADFERCYQLA